ncbi:hypothetical protein F5B20DRAFT_502862 [Whalleya microplaca]|nr:hypothetical protein F5B20DRAFT_502862 [Whalleya microplaca]
MDHNIDRSIDRLPARFNRAFQTRNWRAARTTLPTSLSPNMPSSSPQGSRVSPVPARISISHNYPGDTTNAHNPDAEIPEHSSCSIFITNLPPDCTINMLLGSIRDAGKVYQSSIHPPRMDRPTSAGKVVFWDRAGLDRFLVKVRQGEFIVGDYVPNITMNRVRAHEQPPLILSRAVQVQGPSQIVTPSYMERFFQKHFTYDLNEVRVMFHSEQRVTTRIEFRFASYHAQAAAAWKWIQWAKNSKQEAVYDMDPMEIDLWRYVEVFWGRDPCAPLRHVAQYPPGRGFPQQGIAQQSTVQQAVVQPGSPQSDASHLDVPEWRGSDLDVELDERQSYVSESDLSHADTS